MKAYIVKYWATQGIFPVNGEVLPNGRFMAEYPRGLYGSFAPSEWAASTNEAIEKAKAMREKKLRSLQQQAAKLVSLEIKVEA